MTGSSFNPFAGGEILRLAPTTEPQREIISSCRISSEANTAFNEAVSVELKGEINPELMATSYQQLLSRHEILRSTISSAGDELCLQSDLQNELVVIDQTELTSDQKQAELDALIQNIAISPMNLEEGPLIFAWLVRNSECEHTLVLAAHHLVCDGWTYGVLLSELAEIYSNNGSADQLKAPSSFFDFAEEQAASAVANRDIDFWRARFATTPDPLDLPTDFSRPAERAFSADRIDFTFSQEFYGEIKKAAGKNKVSVNNFLLAAYFVFLQRLTEQEDIVVGLPVAGQAVLNKFDLAGHMVQLLPIRQIFDGSISWSKLVSQVRTEVFDATAKPNFTFGQLMEGMKFDRSRVPLVSTLFNIDQEAERLNFGDAEGLVKGLPRKAENFELFFNWVPRPEDLLLELTYSTKLFSAETIRVWVKSFEILVSTICRTEGDTAIADFPVSVEPPEEVLRSHREAECSEPPSSLLDAIQHNAKQHPERVAVVSEKSLTNSELEEDIRKLASLLKVQGLKQGDLVGVCLRRSENLIVAPLAIHALGAAYLPLDPSFPEDRLAHMVSDSGASFVIHDAKTEALAASFGSSCIAIEDALTAEIASEFVSRLESPDPSNLAYIIYTSGSTGKPKGVRIQHAAMLNFLSAMSKRPGLSESDVLLAVTTLSFDISVLELFLPIFAGARVVIADDASLSNGEKLADLIDSHEVSVMQATPSTWRLLMASAWGNGTSAKSLKTLCGGEPLPRDLSQDLLIRCREVWNMYGPTETTVWSTCKKLSANDTQITIGQPIDNTQCYVLDAANHCVPASVPGELCISGAGLAEGYHDRDSLTKERFIEHSEYGRLYRTGDKAKWLHNGDLVHLGRLDTQVKLRGFRIELGEVEAAISSSGLVDQVAVYVLKVNELDQRLVACCEVSGETLNTVELRKLLRKRLPGYMIPQHFIALDALPLTANGKIDRKRLPKPDLEMSTLIGSGGLQGQTEQLLADIWKGVLRGNANIGREDNFFDLGGHSLLALEMLRQIELSFNKKLEMRFAIAYKLKQLAELLDRENLDASSTVDLRPKALGKQTIKSLSYEQEHILSYQNSNVISTVYNLPASWLLKGSLNTELFSKALSQVLDVQTALRCKVVKDDGAFRSGLFSKDEMPLLELADLSLDAAQRELVSLSEQPFKMLEAPLVRYRLFRTAPEEYLFFFCPHQLVFDGWSFDLFLKSLEEAYRALVEGRVAELGRFDFEFSDYAAWTKQRLAGDAHKEAFVFHSEQLNTPELFEGAKSPEKELCRAEFHMGTQVLEGIEVFARDNSVKLHEVFFAALLEQGIQLSANRGFTCMLPVTGRNDASVIGLIGSFLSYLPFKTDSVNESSFAKFLETVHEHMVSFHSHEAYGLAEFLNSVESSPAIGNRTEALGFSFQDARTRPNKLSELDIMQIDVPRSDSLFMLDNWVRLSQDGVSVFIDYKPSLSDHINVDEVLTNIEKRLLECASGELSEMNVPSATMAKTSIWRRLFG